MSSLMGLGCSPNVELALSLPILVLFLAPIFNAAAHQTFPGLIQADQYRRATTNLHSLDFGKQFSNPSLDDSGWVASEKCLKQVTLLREGFDNGTSWAFEMIDASSKIPSGLLLGNRMDLGMYDECVAVNVVQDGEAIRGRHCMYNVAVEDARIRLMETLSICMPSICEPRDVQDLLNRSFQMFATPAGMNVSVSGVTCSAVDPREWTFGGIVTVFGFSALLLFLIACTICDIFLMYSEDKSETSNRLAVIRQFSLYGNARRILSTESSPETVTSLQGIRFFSMCWVILGHARFILITTPIINLSHMVEWNISWHSIHVLAAPFSVDTFFTISGFLMSHLFLKKMSTGRSFNIFSYYIHRYIRLTSPLVCLMLWSIFILPRMGSGPLWDSVTEAEDEVCRKSWWTMLLYAHNYVNKGCLLHTWSLAVEMHFFWMSPFILYPLAKKPKLGLVILAACFGASILMPAVILYENRYTTPLSLRTDVSETVRTLAEFYMETHIRTAPWLIGMFLGYLVLTFKGPSKKATKWIGWLLAISAFTFCMLSKQKFKALDHEYEVVWETFYAAVARPLWSAAVAWIIYACVNDFGGPVKTILSLPIFAPFSRISYSTYLVHYLIQTMKLKSTRVPYFFTYFNLLNDFTSDLVLATIAGFVFSLVFESPFFVIEKIITKRMSRKTIESKKKM